MHEEVRVNRKWQSLCVEVRACRTVLRYVRCIIHLGLFVRCRAVAESLERRIRRNEV